MRCRFVFTVLLALFLAAGAIHAAEVKSPQVKSAIAAALRNPGVFEEPLITTRATSHDEDLALSQAIASYKRQRVPDDFKVFDRFLTQHPESGWRVALLTNLGLAYYHYGYFSKAIDSWEKAWKAGRSAPGQEAKSLVDRAVGELARMHARLGHADRLAVLFKEVGGRPISGPATEAITGAKEGLWMMRNNPGVAYLCGPLALKNLLLSEDVSPEQMRFLDEYRSSSRGVSLAEVGRLAKQAKIAFKLAYREKNQPIPVPSLVHWKVSHFAALIGETGGRFHIKDPTFGTDLWITREALESESSGYFLIPSEKIGAGLRELSVAEASQVRGMGFTGTSDPGATRPSDDPAMPPDPTCPMCGYNVSEMAVSLNLKDTPVGYAPPKGPPVYVAVTYNQRDAGQPAIFSFFNVSPKWTLNWLSYIQDDPTLPGANVTRYVAGGGYVHYPYYNVPNNNSSPGFSFRETATKVDAILQRTSDSTYVRHLPDGGSEVYSLSNGATTFPRRIFLTQIIDRAGNAVTLNYDVQMRLTSITDATGRNTTFSYELTGAPLLVTRVTDPFGRSAQLRYDGSGRLSQITDIIGLTSSFTYNASSLVTAMTTPYGTTTFAFGTGTGYGPSRFIEITDPLGNHERVEYLQGAPGIPSEEGPVPEGIIPFNYMGSMYMNGRNTFYWDKHVLPLFRGDYTKARIRHWLHDSTDRTGTTTSSVIESVKYPLERRIWRNYPGGGGGSTGALDKPRIVARVLDDGSTQSTQFAYNFRGNIISITDPAGRVTLYDYDSNNGIDLVGIRQKTSVSVFSSIAGFTYNSQHLPLTYTDAAGKTTTYTYNAAGQLIQVTDPLNEATSYVYDGLGYLTQIINPNNKTVSSFTYDDFGRVATRTDSEGYTLSFAYDDADRLTKETYPDGTSRKFTWNRLDLASIRDRQGRTTQYSYDAVRNLIGVTDPLGRQTKFGYYENGKLKTLTDANKNVTTWAIDIENRITNKIYADGKQFINIYEATTSRLKSVVDPLSQVKQYAYALDDQLASVTYLNALNQTPKVTFAYDAYLPQLKSMTDGSGTTQYQYEPLGVLGALRLLKEVGPYQNDTVAYQYDALGRVVGRTVDSSSETFSYDNLGRLISHGSPLGAFSLDYLGQTVQPTNRRLAGGPVRADWAYDSNTNDRRLTQVNNGALGGNSAGLSSAPPRNYHLTTSPGNLVTQVNDVGGGTPQSWNYAYDAADRLIQASSHGGQYAYSYDPADNINFAQAPAGNTNGTYNDVNQAVAFNGRSVVYDANGNLTDDGLRTYQWDAENRLLSVNFKNQLTRKTTFRYDGLGRRIAIISYNGPLSAETRYHWCGMALCQARDSSDVVSKRYYPEGELSFGSPLYYAQDQLGSVRDVLAPQTGHTVASFDYDPYGNIIRSSGAVSTDFRYARMFYEQNSGLYLTQYRPYDSSSGRWLSRDPIGESGGVNLYGYVSGNPVTYTDPLGLACWPSTTSPSTNPPVLSDQQLSAIDTVLAEIQAAAQAAGKSALDFITTRIEPSLSGALTDVGGVLLNLEKGLLDPGVAAGIKAIVDQGHNPNIPTINYSERRQLCALDPADCGPAAR